jgi:hypothetical protein
MLISVKDSDGNDYAVLTLAPGQETTQFTPTDATWTIKFGTGVATTATAGQGHGEPLDLSDLGDEPGGRGGAGVIRGASTPQDTSDEGASRGGAGVIR